MQKKSKPQGKGFQDKEIPRRREKRGRDNYYDERPKGKRKDNNYDDECEYEYED